jgi:hypothetical protein
MPDSLFLPTCNGLDRFAGKFGDLGRNYLLVLRPLRRTPQQDVIPSIQGNKKGGLIPAFCAGVFEMILTKSKR